MACESDFRQCRWSRKLPMLPAVSMTLRSCLLTCKTNLVKCRGRFFLQFPPEESSIGVTQPKVILPRRHGQVLCAGQPKLTAGREVNAQFANNRSGERRVGKECRSRW